MYHHIHNANNVNKALPVFQHLLKLQIHTFNNLHYKITTIWK